MRLIYLARHILKREQILGKVEQRLHERAVTTHAHRPAGRTVFLGADSHRQLQLNALYDGEQVSKAIYT